jgi:predicted RNase H-like nuclease
MDAAMWVAGADGCRGGWIRAALDTRTGEIRFAVVGSARALLELPPRPEVLCVDIPIGLPERGARDCDRLARALLGRPRSSSVFPAPIRAALGAADREQASRITQRIDGRGVGSQAFGLYPKIRAMDELLQSRPDARERIREVHPEVSFWAWNGRRPLAAGKKTPEGRQQRLRLVEGWLGRGLLQGARAEHPRSELADDDVLDAVAVLWTAARIAAGSARTLPDEPCCDATGLRMEIVY